MAARGINWRGVDGAGFYYGFYHDGPTQYQVDIAVPGKGVDAHKGPDYKIFVQGQKVGSMPTLKGAAAFADLWFTEGRHRPRPQQARGQTQAKAQGRDAAAKPNIPQTTGRETIESQPRDRKSMRDVLENYLSNGKPRGRSR